MINNRVIELSTRRQQDLTDIDRLNENHVTNIGIPTKIIVKSHKYIFNCTFQFNNIYLSFKYFVKLL